MLLWFGGLTASPVPCLICFEPWKVSKQWELSSIHSTSIDAITPTGKMIFTVLVAAPSLIAERAKAGLRNARANGNRL
jgi:hypothetical protein